MPVLSELSPDTSLLTSDFDGYKLSLDRIPIFKHDFSGDVDHREPAADQFSFLFAKNFGLHNHLHSDPWTKGQVYFFSKNGDLVQNIWDDDRRIFDCSTVASLDSDPAASGDLNPSVNLDSPSLAAIMDGKVEGLVRVFSTGERNDEKNKETWQEVVCAKIGIAGVVRGVSFDQEENKFQVLVESVVHAETIPELQYLEDKKSSESATLINWLTLDPALGKGEECVVSRRKICVHGAVEYLGLEDGGQAIYLASQKEAFFTFDSARPCTPLIERALREPLNYTWDQTEKEVVVTFSMHSAIDEKSLEVEVVEEEKRLKVTINGPEHSKKVIDGIMAGGVTKEVNFTATDGLVEIRLSKKEETESWEEFIPDDPHGAKAPPTDDVKTAVENLEKFTTEDIDDDKFNSGFNPGQLEECDSEEVSSRFVRLPISSHSPSHTVMLGGHQWIGICKPPPPGPSALLLRHDVDALVWQPKTPDMAQDAAPWSLSHLGTFPGFGYVQASKTSRKWIVTPEGLGWVAVVEGQQHIYIYHQPQPLQTQLKNRKSGQKVPTVARQQVVSLPDNTARVLGAHPENDKLYILHKNSLLVLSMAQD